MTQEKDQEKKDFHVVGKRIPLVDSRRKVTGEAVYTDDIKLPDTVVAKILRSPHPHARITHLDVSPAEELPGVVATAVGADAPANFGVLPISRDETAFAMDKVRFVGDQVAAVAAVDETTARKALELIEVEYEPLAPVFRIDQALEVPSEPNAEKIHPKSKYENNVFKAVDQHFGNVSESLEAAAVRTEGSFHYEGVTHAFTEPHCVIAHYDTEDHLTVWSATQVPHYLHRSLARVMEMPMHRIRVIRPYVGGAFGGKSDPFPHEMAVAVLSRKCRRPVKLLFDREEVFISNHGRHPSEIEVSIAFKEDGQIDAMDIDASINGGAWGSFGVISTYYNGVLAVGPYAYPNFRYSGRRVYTNKPPSGAMRGHGAVNTRFAIETLVDEGAEQLGMDPCDLRIQNAIQPFSTTPNGFRITSVGIVEAIETVREASEWDKKFRKLPYGRGIGLGCGFYISGSALPIHWEKHPQSTVHLKIDFDGGITIHSLAAEIGQGSDTVLAQCVAEVLRCDMDRIRVYARNTDTAPIDLGSYSSRVTFMAGIAARRAAEQVRDTLVRAAADLTGYPWEKFILEDEWIVFGPNPEVRVTFDEAVKHSLFETGALNAKGCYQAPPKMGGTHKGAAAGLSPTYSMGAFMAEVDVDPETGFIKVEKVWAAHDCGRALNPLSVEGQIEGCVHMGLGQVLMESFDYNQGRGQIENANLLDYRTLTSKEMPDVDVFLIETNDPEGPFGAKEAGEGPILPILPAVANAVYDAIGVRMRSLPLTPDKVIDAIEAKKKADRRAEKRQAAVGSHSLRK